MPVYENLSLRDKHTFHLQATTRYWADFASTGELRDLLHDPRFLSLPSLVVGGGSNLLFTGDFNGLLLHSALKDISIAGKQEHSVLVRAGSGIIWDDLVAWTVSQGLCGLENLSGIPGEVGASPVQNVGAYGAEAGDCIESVTVVDRLTGETLTITGSECRFGYRNSRFKQDWRNKFVVCDVTFRLSDTFNPNLKYGDVAVRAEKWGSLSVENVRKAILEIRSEKLPDPGKTGNAGSFFMNPEIASDHYQTLLKQWPDMPGWPLGEGRVKVSAAWCIDRTGWKGKSYRGAAVHDRQALVLINKGEAIASDILELSERIQNDVAAKFGIHLHPEVLFIKPDGL